MGVLFGIPGESAITNEFRELRELRELREFTIHAESYGIVNVKDYGAVGDGKHDDTAAIQRTITAARPDGSWILPSGRFLLSDTIYPLNGQRIMCLGVLQPLRDVSLVSLEGVLNVHIMGSLHVEDPSSVTSDSHSLKLSGGSGSSATRFCLIDKIFMNNVANPLYLRNANENSLVHINCQSTRGSGITVHTMATDHGGVHDNDFGAVMLAGSQESVYGIAYNVASGTPVVGGNKWGRVSCLSFGGDGLNLNVNGGGQIEEWFDTLICDSCGGDGVVMNAGTQKIFIGNLWTAKCGNNGLTLNGALHNPVMSVEIANFYSHSNKHYGALLAHTTDLLVGQAKVHSNGLSGIRIVQSSHRVNFGICVTSNNIGGLTSGTRGHYGFDDGGDSSSSQITVGTLQALDGYSLSQAAQSHLGLNPSVGMVTPPASPLVSSTIYRNTLPFGVLIYQLTFADTAGTAGSVDVALGASKHPPLLFTQQVSGSTTRKEPEVIQVRVPPGWYYSFTAHAATLLDARIQGEP